MALSTMSNSLSHLTHTIRDHAMQIRDQMQTRHWVTLGLGLVAGIAAWKLMSRPVGIPPGPKGLPLVGNLFQISAPLYQELMQLGEKYGDIFSLYFGPRLVIILNSHQMIKEAFVNAGPMFADRHDSILIPGLEESLASRNYDDRYISLRKHTMVSLRSAGYGTKEGESCILDGVDDLLKFLQQKKPSEAIELQQPLQKVAANVIMKILVGKQFTWDDPQLIQMIEDVSKYINSFDEEFTKIDMVPQAVAKIIFKKSLKKVHDAFNHLGKTYMESFVAENKESHDPENPSTFVDYFIKDNEENNDWSVEQVTRFCCLFFPDAISPVAYLLMWDVLLFTYFPEIQSKIQQEIHEVLGTQRPNLSARSKMNYTQAFLLEVIRFSTLLCLSVPHKPKKDATLAGYKIPENAQILANFWAINMDPKIWDEPSLFKPERHLDENGVFVQKDNVTIFGQGRRMCIGEQLVKTELFLITVSMLQHFIFKFPDDEPKPNLKLEKEVDFRVPPHFKVCVTHQ